MKSVRDGIFQSRTTFVDATIALALVLLLILTLWGLSKDYHALQEELLLAEINDMRSRAGHAVGHIEQNVESTADADLENLEARDASALLQETIDGDTDRYPYVAIVTPDGVIAWHTDRGRQGKRLGHEWYENVVYDLGADVVTTRSPVLTGGDVAYDLRIPILANGQDIGRYHIGLSQAWFNRWFSETRTEFLWRRCFLLGGILLVIVAASVSLYARSRQMRLLQKTVTDTYMQAASELGRLAAGLAHEIRNPLHALRLNLHAFRRTQQEPDALEPAEIACMLEQSTGEIDRIDKLLHQLIDFATPTEPRAEPFNLNAELQGVVDFIQQELRRSNTDVQLDLPRCPISVRMDPARLRQIMLNLLHNARDSMPEGGRVDVGLARKDARVEILVSDQGNGVAEADLPHIFEPFFTTSDDGTGLGLALVKRFVQEAGGDIRCEANHPQGTRFRIWLNEAASAKSQRRER